MLWAVFARSKNEQATSFAATDGTAAPFDSSTIDDVRFGQDDRPSTGGSPAGSPDAEARNRFNSSCISIVAAFN